MGRLATTWSFRLGSIPVRFDLWLPAMGVLLGLSFARGLGTVLAAVASLIVTVFAHELAHTVALRSFGAAAEVHVTLLGHTLGRRLGSLSPAQRIVSSLGGPVASLGLGAIAITVAQNQPSGRDMAQHLALLGFFNLGWGLVNLLPILPLDAGHALVALVDGPTDGQGERHVRRISIVASIALGVVAVWVRMPLAMLVCAMLAFQNARGLRARIDQNRNMLEQVHVQAAFDAAVRGDTVIAIRHCRTVLSSSQDEGRRRDAIRLLAYSYAENGDWPNLLRHLESGGAAVLAEDELEKYESVARELGHPEEANRIGSLRGVCGAGPVHDRRATHA